MIRVAIADDHVLLLEGLREALDGVPDISVIATATNGRDLVDLVATTLVDVILVDIEMPGMTGIAALREMNDPPPAIVVTMHIGDEERRRAGAAGATGFVSKSTPLPDLAAAIRAVYAGERLMDPDELKATLDRHRQPDLGEGGSALTARERELLQYLASGTTSTQDLADQMFISQKTVKNHLASIYDKLGVTDRAQAAVEAIRLGLHKN
jgi:DNA-binding NarL/FixJ family response regulator